MAVVDHPTKFILYILFFFSIWSTIAIVDSLDHTSTTKEMITGYKKNKKNALEEAPQEIEKEETTASLIAFAEPQFKPFVKVQPNFKHLDEPLEPEVARDKPEPTPESVKEAIKETTAKPEKKELEKGKWSVGPTASTYFTELRKSYEKRVLDKIAPGDIRRDIIIRYYTHEPDGKKVYKLEELGFYIHERPVEDGLDNYESNAIYYGDNVTKEDLQLVIYMLIKQGIPIKKVSLSKYHDGWKASSIEIGTDTTATKSPVYTPERIMALNP